MASMSSMKIRFCLCAVALVIACSFMACKGRSKSGDGKDAAATTVSSIVYATTQVTPEALKDVFEALDKKLEGKVFVNFSTSDDENALLNLELLKCLAQKLNLDSTVFNHSNAADAYSEMKIPVCDTTAISHHFVYQFLAYYDFLINIGSIDRYSNEEMGGILQMISSGMATDHGKTAIREGGPRAMAVAAKAVHDYYLGGMQIAYIMIMGDKEYGILASEDPVALDQACLDIVRNQIQSGDTTRVYEAEGLKRAEEAIEWAEKINLGCKTYQLECLY